MDKEKKIQIIKAAVKRFAKHGLNKTTLDEIARDLRIGKATIYHYFDSKEDLFYETLNWESELFIQNLKVIFNNEDMELNDRFMEYFSYKETIEENLKLLYDVVLLVLSEQGTEKEMEFLENLLRKEEEILKLVLSSVYSDKIESMNPTYPAYFVLQSWGILFENKLNTILSPDKLIDSKEILFTTLKSIVS